MAAKVHQVMQQREQPCVIFHSVCMSRSSFVKFPFYKLVEKTTILTIRHSIGMAFYLLAENPSFTLSIGIVHGHLLEIYFYATNIMDIFGISSTIVGVLFLVGLGFSTIKTFYIKLGDQQG